MSIGIYTAANAAVLVSQNGDFTNPLLVPLDGRIGGVMQKRLYLRNNASNRSYETITVRPEDVLDPGLLDGTRGIHWKLKAGDIQPTDEEWLAVATGNTLNMPNLGTALISDTSTYLPFWLYVKTPRNINAETITGVQLVIGANELLV